MPWTRGEPLSAVHRARLLECGVLPEVLDALMLRAVTGPLPRWWHEQGNALYLRDGMTVPTELIEVTTRSSFRDALLVLGTGMEWFSSLLVGGDGATVFIGPDTYMTAADLYCGGGSAIVLNEGVLAPRCAVVDARNGGSVVAGPDQLWAANVYIATDDMHRLEDVDTGTRINPYGAHVRLGRHVWLGRDAIISGPVEVGEGSVVGMRSIVRGQKVPPFTAVAGVPARVVREGVTWTHEDTP